MLSLCFIFDFLCFFPLHAAMSVHFKQEANEKRRTANPNHLLAAESIYACIILGNSSFQIVSKSKVRTEPEYQGVLNESYTYLNSKDGNPTPVWKNWKKKDVFVDPVKRTIEARQSLGSDRRDGKNTKHYVYTADRRKAEFTRIEIEPGAQKLTVFVDWIALRPTTEAICDDPEGNDHLATYNLDILPFPWWKTLYRKLGGRTDLYVRNFDPSLLDDLTKINLS